MVTGFRRTMRHHTPRLGTTGTPLRANTSHILSATYRFMPLISSGVRGTLRSLSCLINASQTGQGKEGGSYQPSAVSACPRRAGSQFTSRYLPSLSEQAVTASATTTAGEKRPRTDHEVHLRRPALLQMV